MAILFKKMPIEAGVVVPLVPLAEVVTHEEQLLARMSEHVAIDQPKVCELLPLIARHLAKHRALPEDHFIVRKRQDVIFAEGVNQAEQDLVVVVRAENGIPGCVIERVVHPPHVPLESKAKSTEPCWF